MSTVCALAVIAILSETLLLVLIGCFHLGTNALGAVGGARGAWFFPPHITLLKVIL